MKPTRLHACLRVRLSSEDHLGAIDGGLLAISTLISFSGMMFAPVYLDWITSLGIGTISSVAALWTLAAPALGVTLGIPFFTWLIRDFGPLRMLRLGCALLFMTGSMVMLANNVSTFLFARGLVGVAVSALMVGTNTIFAMRYPGVVWRDWLGVQDVVVSLAGIIGLLLVGWLAFYGWQVPLLLHLIGLPAYGLVWWLSNQAGLVALIRRHERLDRWRIARPPSTPALGHNDVSKYGQWLQWVIVATIAITMLQFFGLVQIVAAIVSVDLHMNAMGIGASLAVLMAGIALASARARVVTSMFGDYHTIVLTYVLSCIAYVSLSKAGTLVVTLGALFVLGLTFGALRYLLLDWLDRVAKPSNPASRFGITMPSYYVGMTVSPLFVFFVQDWRDLMQTCGVIMLLIGAVYMGIWLWRLRRA